MCSLEEIDNGDRGSCAIYRVFIPKCEENASSVNVDVVDFRLSRPSGKRYLVPVAVTYDLDFLGGN